MLISLQLPPPPHLRVRLERLEGNTPTINPGFWVGVDYEGSFLHLFHIFKYSTMSIYHFDNEKNPVLFFPLRVFCWFVKGNWHFKGRLKGAFKQFSQYNHWGCACSQLVLNHCLYHNLESLPFKLSPGVFENVPSLVDEEVKVAVIRDTLRLMDPLKKKRESQ